MYNYTSGDYNLYQINNDSSSLNLVKEKLVESDLCYKYTIQHSFVNKLSDSFIYGCQKTDYSYSLRKIHYLQGSQSVAISSMGINSYLMTTPDGDYSYVFRNRYKEYKGKIYFVASVPYVGYKLASINDQNQVVADAFSM